MPDGGVVYVRTGTTTPGESVDNLDVMLLQKRGHSEIISAPTWKGTWELHFCTPEMTEAAKEELVRIDKVLERVGGNLPKKSKKLEAIKRYAEVQW